MHLTKKYPQHSSIIWPVGLNGWKLVYEVSGCGFKSPCCHLETSNIVPVSSKEFLDIHATIECRFPLKHLSDMIRRYSHFTRFVYSLKIKWSLNLRFTNVKRKFVSLNPDKYLTRTASYIFNNLSKIWTGESVSWLEDWFFDPMQKHAQTIRRQQPVSF